MTSAAIPPRAFRSNRGHSCSATTMEFEESGNRVFDIVSASKSVSDKFDSRDPNQKLTHKGTLIINADDWGRDNETTGRILDCVVQGTVSSVSAMVFMADSARAAEIACERGIDAGLHLNFTTTFSDGKAPAQMAAHQERLARYLRSSRLAPAVFHPGLSKSFEYVVASAKRRVHPPLWQRTGSY